MVSNPNFYGQSTTGTPNQIEDNVDFPHTGLIKALSDGLGQNYAISGFDITGTDATALTVADGKIFRDGELVDVTGDSLTLSSFYTNGYHLLVAPSGASPTVVLRNPTAADKVAEYDPGDTIIAVLTHTGANPLSVQYLTVDKTKNSLSVGEGSGTYSEEMSITSDGTDVTFTGSSNTNMDFTPSGTGKVRVTTGDLEVQNGNFEVPNGYSEITAVKSITDGGGAGLSAGAPVYPTNYASGRITVQLADATIAASKYPAIGLVYDTITASGNGKVVVQGLTGDISATLFDAGSYSEGDIIYLSPNVGKLTNTRPTADTDAIQNIGRIVHLSTFTAGSSGTAKILVQGSGRSNDVTNDGFVTTNASSIPTARQITAGTGITLNDGGAGSTLEVVNSAPDQTVTLAGAGITQVTGNYPNFTITSTEADTLDSVVSRGDTTTRNISVGVATVDGLTNEGKTTIVPIDPTNANIDLGLVNYGNTVYYIDGNAGPIMSLADGANGQIIHIKNSDTVNQVVINTTSPIDGAGAAEDKRRTSSTQITLLATEGITLQYVNDVTGIATGWYILDTDTNATSGISNVVEDTTPQLGGMLDVNGNSIGDGTNELLSFSETASAVNYLEITNAATTNDPKLSAAGSDTNIGIEIESKGTGLITLDGNVLMGEVVGTYGTAPRNLNLIGPDAVMRVARTSTLAYAPAMELIHLSSDGNTTNAYFDIFLETDKLQFRDRTTAGGAGQAAGIEILTLMEGTGKVGIQNPSPTADLDLVDGGTFRSTRLLTVNITADDTLTESEHAGRYCFVTGASRTITLGATTADVAAGIHYTLISNDANGFTLTSTKTMNGSSDDITVTARNAVTIIADGSNYVVLGA